MNPGPVLLTVSNGSFRELSDAVQPRLTIVETDLDSLHLVAASIVSIASNTIRMALLDIRYPDALTMSRLGDDRIQVLFVAGCIRVTEEGFGELAILLGNERGLRINCQHRAMAKYDRNSQHTSTRLSQM